MRVISGDFRGRRLLAPKDANVRPTSDRVKEAIFSMLLPELPGAVCLDLFAGTGALGIEALSRGAARVYFCDNLPASVALLRQNLSAFRIDSGRAIVFACDWSLAVARLPEKCNLVLIDAPYRMCEHYSQMLEALSARRVLEAEALILIERDVRAGGYSPPEGFEIIREKRYGNVGVDLILYKDTGDENDR